MTTEQMRWIVEWCTETGALLFMWHGSCGEQPVLMPGFVYYWWLDGTSDETDSTDTGRYH